MINSKRFIFLIRDFVNIETTKNNYGFNDGRKYYQSKLSDRKHFEELIKYYSNVRYINY